jgi:hypothetical protein
LDNETLVICRLTEDHGDQYGHNHDDAEEEIHEEEEEFHEDEEEIHEDHDGQVDYSEGGT